MKRLSCRIIEKTIVKVALYMMKKHNLAFTYKETYKFMKKC